MNRPGVVTFIAVLVLLQGFFHLLASVVTFIYRNNSHIEEEVGLSGSELTTGAVVYLISAIVLLAVGGGLLSGSRLSRALVAIAEFVAIAAAAITLFTHHTGAFVTSAIITVLWAIFVLWALYNERADDYFRGVTDSPGRTAV